MPIASASGKLVISNAVAKIHSKTSEDMDCMDFFITIMEYKSDSTVEVCCTVVEYAFCKVD